MAPTRTKKQKTSASSDESIPAFPAPPSAIPSTANEPSIQRTPEKSTTQRSVGITQRQKQALIDNLRHEITARARRLRQEYAEQAQALQARLERRVNIIPSALRKRNIQELLDEHEHKMRPAPPPPMPVAAKTTTGHISSDMSAPMPPSRKRNSDQMSSGDDKENDPGQLSQQELAQPKKRVKAITANTKATRAVSKPTANGVLSPKSHNSHNSRTLVCSPIKPAPAKKPALPRPASPVKVPLKSTARAPTRTTSRQQDKRATNHDENRRISDSSNTSNGTTIVKKATTKKTTTAATKKAAVRKPTATTKKTVALKKENAPPVPAVGRTLRKRG